MLRSPFVAGPIGLILSITVLSLTSAHAEPTPEGDDPDASASADESYTVRTVERAEVQRADRRFASASVTRVATDDLTFRGQTLGDVLGHVAGVNIRQLSSFGQPAFLSIRGGNPRQIAVELDGLRLDAPVGLGFDAGQMMTDGIASADVYRGSGAALFGGGAVTGAMRLNPATAPRDGWELQARTMAGSYGTQAFSTVAGTGDDTRGVRLHAGLRNSRGDYEFLDDQGTAHQRANNDHLRMGLGATAHLEQGDHRLRLTTGFESGDAGSPGPSEFQETSGQARIDDDRILAALRWEADQVADRGLLDADAFATLGAQQRRMHYSNEASHFTRQPFDSVATERTVAASTGIEIYAGASHLLHLEASGRLEQYDAQVQAQGQGGALNAYRQTAAVAFGDEWLLFDERLSLIGVVRAEASRTADDSSTQPLLPAVGAIGRVHRRVELRANAARTFRLPHFDELYLQTEGVRGNPDLAPEQAWTTDFTVAVGADDDPALIQLAGFAHAMDSTILFLPISAYTIEAQNLTGATSRGVELMGRLQPAHRWSLTGAYTHTRAHLDAPSSEPRPQLPGEPRHRLRLASTVDLADLQLAGAARLRSPVHLDNFGNLTNPSALFLDLGITWRVDDQLRAALRAQNLLNHRHAQDSLHRPLPGRAFFLSLEIRGQGDR